MKKKTLYLLRKPLDRIDPSLFLASESGGDLVLLEEGSPAFSYTGGAVFSLGTSNGQPNLSYDLLVKKIFESDYTVVI
jgi:hypothetical protein